MGVCACVSPPTPLLPPSLPSHAPAQTVSLGSGYNDMAKNISVKASDKFLFGSTTKMITATRVLQLVETGRLSLDEAVAERTRSTSDAIAPRAEVSQLGRD